VSEGARPAHADVSMAHWRGGYVRQSLRRLREDRLAVVAGMVLITLTLAAVLAPAIGSFVTHVEYDQQDLLTAFSGPSWTHPLGSDELGRDTLTRLVWGGRVSLGVGFLAVALYIVIGGGVGLAAGFYGGALDAALMRVVDVLLSVPIIFLLILVTSLLPLPLGPDPTHPWFIVRHDALSISAIIAITSWGGVARLVRAEVLVLRNREFMLAARAVGASDRRLVLGHLLPNAFAVLIVAASIGVGQVILIEAALDFIGLGVQPPTPSWGNMLLNAQAYFSHSPLLVFVPGLTILAAVLCTNIFGNALRDAFDPRL
jgi:peptide/nickel transport system permease protein